MSNPGPAVTSSIHPSQLGTNQALRLLAVSKGVSLASDTDTAVNVINTSAYVPATVVVANANNSGSAISSPASVYFGVYTAASQGGNAILTTATMSASFTSTTYVSVATSSTPALAESAQTLYVNVATATVSGTVDVYVYGYDLSGPQQ
jgi:histidinol dehydrogenase